MPGGDGRGPRGFGPMTGRATGYCAGFDIPGCVNFIGQKIFKRWGGGRRGFRNQFYETGMPGWQRTGRNDDPMYNKYSFQAQRQDMSYNNQYAPTKEQELDILKNQSEYLKNEISNVNKRINELEGEEKK